MIKSQVLSENIRRVNKILVTNKKPPDQSLGMAMTSVTPGTSVGVTSPHMPTSVKRHHGWSS